MPFTAAHAADTGVEPRLFNVREYYRMAEVGILGPDERVELIEGKVLRKHTNGERRLWNVREYYQMAEAGILGPEERVELIEGKVLCISPVGSRHAGAVNRLNQLLASVLSGRAITTIQNPVRLGDRSEPEPDVAVLRPRDDFYGNAHPTAEDVLLLIEVSDSSVGFDRGEKLATYGRNGMQEVWVVDVQKESVHVHRRPHPEGWDAQLVFRRGQSLSPEAFPDLELTVDQILGPENPAQG